MQRLWAVRRTGPHNHNRPGAVIRAVLPRPWRLLIRPYVPYMQT